MPERVKSLFMQGTNIMLYTHVQFNEVQCCNLVLFVSISNAVLFTPKLETLEWENCQINFKEIKKMFAHPTHDADI